MTRIWSDERKYSTWLEVECLALEGMAKVGIVPEDAAKEYRQKGKFDVERVLEIEAEVKHDVIAFLTCVAEHAGDSSKYAHRGMTSNDLLDTSFAVQLKEAGELILEDLDEVLQLIRERATEFKMVPCIGRSHGIHAEPISFGLKLASWFAELERQRNRFADAVKDVSTGKLAGAVGTYASLPPAVEQYVLGKLGLEPETVATQVVSRDRHAAFFVSLGMIASSIERFAVEIRHLQRSEVREVQELFTPGQKGSSAMPHKKNPILTENITGLARLVRGYVTPALENIALWHERDISHSSVERVIAPDACIATDFMLKRFALVVKGMRIDEAQMEKNLELTNGLIYSGTLLLALVDKGVLRETAYAIVQKVALTCSESGADFKQAVLESSEMRDLLTEEEIAGAFDVQRHLAHVDYIFERTFQ